jgi:hypothetical protein
MVVEAAADRHVPWISPQDIDEEQIVNLGTASMLPHQAGVQAALVSGAVRFVSSQTDVQVLRAMATIAGGDDESASAEGR